MAAVREVALAVDIGGTWVRSALVDRAGRVVWHSRVPTRPDGQKGSLVERVDGEVQGVLKEATGWSVRGVGLSLAGPTDPATGMMHSPPHLPELDGVSFSQRWQERLGLPVVAANDASLAALAEHAYGAGGGARVLIYITISTGIGGGIVFNGEPFLGAYGLAGEIGHTVVELDGPRCRCGGSGCLEAIASGTGIAEIARSRLAAGEASLISSLAPGRLASVEAPQVFAAAAAGDALAREIVERAGRALGAGFVNLVHLFNPDMIVVGGAVSQQWDVLWPTVEGYLGQQAMPPFRGTLKVVRSALGDDIGLLGAAAYLWRSITPGKGRP